MALKGAFNQAIGNFWRLRIEWSATQNIANNTSTVKVDLYWESSDSRGSIYSSATKPSRITLDGTATTKNVTPALSGKQKKLIHSQTKTVTHNADGKKTINVSASFDIAVTLTGVYRGSVSIPSKKITLDTIPRASTISSNANWTATNNKSVSISRATTKFTHNVNWQVKNRSGSWVTVKSATGVKTSNNGAFTVAENKSIFTTLDGRASADSRITIQTRNGSTNIGGLVTKTGKVTAPTASKAKSTSYKYDVEDGTNIGITRSNTKLNHKVVFKFGSFTKTINNVDTVVDLAPTVAQKNTIYGLMSTSNSIKGTATISTMYEGVQVRTDTSTSVTLKVSGANPIFGGAFTFKDSNTTTAGITGNSQYLIQNRSELQIQIPATAKAEGNKGATMSKYVVNVNGVSKSINYSTSAITLNFGKVDASNDVSISVQAIDSRNNYTTRSKTVKVLPYKNPYARINAERLNNFEESTTISINGDVSLLKVGTANKNALSKIEYRNKKRSVSAYSAWKNVTFSTSGDKFTATKVTLDLDNMVGWDFQFRFTDKLGNRVYDILVPVGKPIMFMDSEKNSVGINVLPKQNYSFEVEGKIWFSNSMNPVSNRVDSYIGSVETAGREYIMIRSDDRGARYGAGINLYSDKDPTNPGKMILYFGNRPYAGGGVMLDHEGIKLRAPAKDGWTNYLSIRSAQEVGYEKLYPNSIGNVPSRFPIAFMMQTSVARTIFFGTTTGANISLETHGNLYLPNLDGVSRRIELSDQHMISTKDGQLTMYPNRAKSGGFQIRSHVNKASYLTDWLIDSDGIMRSRHFWGKTSSSAVNARVSYDGSSTNGTIYRVTSAKKYKVDIQDADVNPYNLLNMKPKMWNDLFEYRENGSTTRGLQKHYGLIADELEEVGLNQYVDYANGEVEGLHYERLWTLLIPIMKDQVDEIKHLKDRVDVLTDIINRR